MDGLSLKEFLRSALAAGLVALALLAAGPRAAGAAEARLMERWLVHDSLSRRAIDHSAWGEILSRYLSERGGRSYFDYAAVTRGDRDKLDRYIAALARADIDRLDRPEQRAFWLNAYNALVVQAVLEAWPVDSVNEAGGGLFTSGPWAEKRFRVYQIDLSLDDIVNRILRPIWEDPMTLYGLACGAAGCPPLKDKPYTGDNARRALAENARRFVNGGGAVLLIDGEAARLSSFYRWYRDDFGGGERAVLAHIRALADGGLAARLEGVRRISGHGFDWSLNAPPR